MLDKDETTINVSKIQDTLKCLPSYLQTDIITIEVPYAYKSIVNCVDNFITDPFAHYGRTETWGYPGELNVQANLFIRHRPSVIVFHEGKHYYVSNYTDTIYKGALDSLNYVVVPDNFTANSSLNGLSGAPVFSEDSASGQWRIVGPFIASTENKKNNDVIFVVKIKYALNQIKTIMNLYRNEKLSIKK